MDRREPSRIPSPSSPIEEAGRPRPFARIVSSPAARRLATPRIVVVLVVGLVALLLAGMGGVRAIKYAFTWQHNQAQHSLPFDQIELVPEPPDWIGPGRAGLLEQVRERAGWGPEVKVLDEDLAGLAKAFTLESPWVRRVFRVERAYPRRLIVRLEYREPVGVLAIGKTRIGVASDGVALPWVEIKPSERPFLIPIKLDNVHLAGARSGLAIAISDQPNGPSSTLPMQTAAGLAELLRERRATAAPSPLPIKVTHIIIDKEGLWAEAAARTMIYWGPISPGERQGLAANKDKWTRLCDWAASNELAGLKEKVWIDLSGSGVVLRSQ